MQTTREFLQEIIGSDEEIELRGTCHDCGCKVSGVAYSDNGKIHTNFPFWYIDGIGAFAKCEDCFEQNPHLTRYQPTEVFSRVCGYVRPVKQYNPGKQAEKAMRVDFKIDEEGLKNG